MKIISEVVRITVFFAIVSLVTSSLERVNRSLSTVQHLIFETDDALSQEAIKEIESYVYMLRFNGCYNPAALVNHLPSRFMCIDSIESQSLANNTAKLVIKTKEPLAIISHDELITTNGSILLQYSYDPKLLAQLDRVEVARPIDTEKIPILVKTISQALQSDLCKTYDITWINEHNIRLKNKNDQRITIICSDETLPNQTVQEKCVHIAKTKQMQKPNAQWNADIRFDDQIIISMDKRGGNGTCV